LIVHDLVEEGISPVVITNAARLDASLLRKMPRGIHYEVTLFSHQAHVHDALAGRKVFERVVENLVRIENYGSYFTLVFVAMKPNALDVLRTVELGLALGARGVMYNRINISKGTRPHASEVVPPVGVLRESLGLLQEAVTKYGIQSACSIPVLPCVVDPTEYPDLHFGWCPRGGADAYYTIGSTGLLRPCNHSSRVLGDMLKDDFIKLIERKETQDFWQAIPAECQTCTHPLKEECNGGCPAAADEFYGSPNHRDPYFELSQESSVPLRDPVR
jgi:radical SAM protein with 4Fe4S-binding SPASM domain